MKKKEVSAPQAAEPAEPKPPKPKKKKTVWLDLAALLLRVAWILLFFGAMLVFVVGVTVNSGARMTPSFHDRDVVIYYRLDHQFSAGDVVAYPGENGTELGRVVAVPGDRVDIDEKGLKLNGYVQAEPYAAGDTVLFEDGAQFPITLGEGDYVVLCDNRAEGDDSRILGPIHEKDILGRVMLSIRQRDF